MHITHLIQHGDQQLVRLDTLDAALDSSQLECYDTTHLVEHGDQQLVRLDSLDVPTHALDLGGHGLASPLHAHEQSNSWFR